jgi:transposase
MVLYAQAHGVKAAARVFATTPKTVRKWRDRFDGRLGSLAARSRAPHHRPRRLSPEAEQRIVALKTRLPRWSARRLRRDFDLPWSEKAIRRVFRDHGLARRYRRRKHETKRYLRNVKKRWRLFQQIDIDTKHLNDIPEYWVGLASRRLPRYQYTARDVTTGLLFLGYADELSLAHATVFAQRILTHLKACGIRLARTTWQSDNGSEFVGSWQAKEPSAFTKTIEAVPGQRHRTIPPGQHRFQADVETVHSLMETEFFEVESFRDRSDFLAKATSYQLWFNLARKNSGKENRTPWDLVRLKCPTAHPLLPLLTPVFLDQLLFQHLHNPSARGYDVWALPCPSVRCRRRADSALEKRRKDARMPIPSVFETPLWGKHGRQPG